MIRAPQAYRTGGVRRGFSIVEAFVSMVILTLAVLVLTTAYPYAFGRIGERDDELQAVSFGQQYLESVRQQIRTGATSVSPTSAPIDAGYPLAFGVPGYPAPAASASPPTELTSPGYFTATATTNPALTSTSNSFDVTATVTWSYGGTSRSVLLQTVVTRL
jgi:type II secretory pathway pseudopilin PulG